MHAPASLDVVEDAVRREFDAQERRADAADTRAGLVLGFAGLVVSVGGDGWLPLVLTSRVLAGLAGLAALGALAPRALSGVDAPALRECVESDPTHLRLTLLKADVGAVTDQLHRIRVKMARLRLASRLLMAALVFATLAAIVDSTA